jgi:predicted nucleic acid-binding protein
MQSPSIPPSLRLVVDTNFLAYKLFSQWGRDLLAHPRLDLFITARIWGEFEHELVQGVANYVRNNADQSGNESELERSIHDFVSLYVVQVAEAVYAPFEKEARARIPHDPDDWPTVALALALDAAIWTEDRHFLGRGLATWRTDALREYLA